MNAPQNVLLIDDHKMVNAGIASILEETGRFKIAGAATTLNEAKRFMEANKGVFLSLIVLDIMMGEDNGLDFLNYLKDFCNDNECKKPAVLVCSVLEEPFNIQFALNMGAEGYISKTSSKNELLEAIDTVLRGETYVSGEHSAKIVKSKNLYSKFTRREMEILNLVKSNKPNNQIAEDLCLSIRTIENHISNIYYKAGVKDRRDLMKL